VKFNNLKEGYMKRMAIAVSVAVLLFGVAILANTQAESVEQELMKLENEWAKSQVKPDFAFMERILADDYTWTEPTGEVLSKADEIAALRSGESQAESVINDEMKVRVYGDAAVVAGRTTYKATVDGKPYTGQLRWTDTWVKITGRWQCVAGHGSRIAQK
jgi:ketosteroid isomerase-like protein